MANPAKSRATYEDVLNAPAGCIAEIIHGVLHTQPRPAAREASVASALGIELGGPFQRGRGGPGGWVVLDEPELYLAEHVLVPDLAGWRRARMPEIPDVAGLELAPDWVCEVLSPSTAARDRTEKMPIYAEQGVGFAWLLDPVLKTLEAFRLESGKWMLTGAWRDPARVRAEPFEAIELELEVLFAR